MPIGSNAPEVPNTARGEFTMLAELWYDQNRGQAGEARLKEVAASLWAQDCQSCGQALDPESPALCVDELSGCATAGLHHRRCRPPGWNDTFREELMMQFSLVSL
jgi:hypothetical protein